jgi:hypothetical protein
MKQYEKSDYRNLNYDKIKFIMRGYAAKFFLHMSWEFFIDSKEHSNELVTSSSCNMSVTMVGLKPMIIYLSMKTDKKRILQRKQSC